MLLNVNEFLSRPKQTQLGCIFHRFTTVAGCFLDYNKICVEKNYIDAVVKIPVELGGGIHKDLVHQGLAQC